MGNKGGIIPNWTTVFISTSILAQSAICHTAPKLQSPWFTDLNQTDSSMKFKLFTIKELEMVKNQSLTLQDLNAIKEILAPNFNLLEQKIKTVETTLGKRIDDVETTLGKRIDDVETTLGKRIDDVETTLGKRIDDVETTLGKRIDDVETNLNTLMDVPNDIKEIKEHYLKINNLDTELENIKDKKKLSLLKVILKKLPYVSWTVAGALMVYIPSHLSQIKSAYHAWINTDAKSNPKDKKQSSINH